jgi:sialic acid synthase SpsE/sugar phosphate isomerase/epimerase/CBS domain-containing protein
MIIDKKIASYLVLDQESIRDALNKISSNEEGMIVCVDNAGLLLGALTDGDFRRWVISEKNPELDKAVGTIINRDIVSARVTDSVERMTSLLGHRVHFLPLTDKEGRCVALARKRIAQFAIERHKIGSEHPCYVIAEIGNNHNGSYELACKLVDEAVLSGADCAKFQLRDLAALYINKGDASDAKEDLGSQYTLDLLSRFQLSLDDMFRIFDYCYTKGITPLCTPWDLPSLDALEKYGISGYKSASADFTNHDLLMRLADTGKPIICSTGMCAETEIRESVMLLRSSGAQYALLHCNSTYPAPFKDLNLNYMENLRRLGDCPVGYSSHDRGINIAVAAVALGANIIEKHFTLDRAMEGNDHRVSLLPQEFSDMIAGIRQTEQALGGTDARRISQGELMNREALGKSLVINVPLEIGQTIEGHMLEVRSPGKGLQPNRKSNLIGKVAKRSLVPGDILFPSDLGDEVASPRDYSFKRPFGIPVRYHDLKSLAKLSNFDLLEFHLSYKDMMDDESCYFDNALDMDLVVHAPELFEGDHVMDLCSFDVAHRELSIQNLRKVIEVTKRLKKWFLRAERPRIIINAGGFTQDKHLEKAERDVRYEMIAESLSQIDLDDVEIIPQTMPPFPWHFGGQRYQNLFMDPDETSEFCKKYGYRVCLDISHSKLACNQFHWSFSEFVKEVGPYTAHLHIVDASGVDGEGLQINEGNIDFPALARDLETVAPGASFIPEIWQGHKNEGAGFWCALERLESDF